LTTVRWSTKGLDKGDHGAGYCGVEEEGMSRTGFRGLGVAKSLFSFTCFKEKKYDKKTKKNRASTSGIPPNRRDTKTKEMEIEGRGQD